MSAINIVAQPVGAYGSPMPSDWGYILEQERQDAAARLRAIEDVDASAIYGAPFEELAAFGDHVDLLVVGSRSYGPVRRVVFGSTSSHLTRHARCPCSSSLARARGSHRCLKAPGATRLTGSPQAPEPRRPRHPVGGLGQPVGSLGTLTVSDTFLV